MGWHIRKPESEFRAEDAAGGYRLDGDLEQEDRIFAELDSHIAESWSTQSAGAYNRCNPQFICNPETIGDRNWNRTHVIRAANPVGGALLVLGSSDSTYSLGAGDSR